MSSPTQIRQLDEVQDAPRKANHEVEEPVDTAIAQSGTAIPESLLPSKDTSTHEDIPGAAGQAPASQEEVGQTEHNEEKGEGGEVRNGMKDIEALDANQENPASSLKWVREPQPPTTAPPAQTTPQTDTGDLSSTTPLEELSKSAGKAPMPFASPPPPPPPPKDDRYLSSGNGVPSRSMSPVSPVAPVSPVSQGKSSGRNSEDAAAAEYGAKDDGSEDVVGDSKSEIQSIMEQFEQDDGGLGADEIMSPRMELAGPLLESPVTHPPRRSSLVPIDKPLPTPSESAPSARPPQSPPPRASSLYRGGTSTSLNEPMSPSAHAPQYKPAPPVPQPDPEPDLPFDFHRFLEQLRHRTADPVAKFLRSFLLEFGKKQWMVHEQVKIIADFLEFISKKMAQCEVWRTVSDAEFDNAREGMEKLVMNRLYSQTFSPAIAPPEPVHPKGKRRGEPPGPGRRGQHQEDVERDEVLAQKVRIYKWVKEDHLDIQPVGEKGRKFLLLAQQELLKIKSYRAPRDKVICVLNCCKVIFGFLRTSQSDQSADAFVPLLIYTVLQANPDHLVSNVQYILRFRNQDKLGGEAGYYISSLMGAIQFIESLDRTSLTVSDEEFEKNVEAAVSAIAEKHPNQEPTTPESSEPPRLRLQTNPPNTPGHRRMPSPHLHVSEKSTLSRPEITPRNSLEAEKAGPHRSSSFRSSNGRSENGEQQQQQQPEEENAAVAGLLRTIQKPLSTIGRIFSDDTNTSAPAPQSSSSAPRLSPQPAGHTRRSSDYPPNNTAQAPLNEKELPRRSADEQRHRDRLTAADAAARQASAEAEEARRIQRQEHLVVVETLAGMFPALDREVIDDVVRMKEGRVGLAVDACLALSNP